MTRYRHVLQSKRYYFGQFIPGGDYDFRRVEMGAFSQPIGLICKTIFKPIFNVKEWDRKNCEEMYRPYFSILTALNRTAENKDRW